MPNAGLSLWLVVFTGAMIVFYDFAAKYLVPLGLLSLGLIRFFHATIAAPNLPVFWHPLLLMNHVTIVSTIAYYWEHKRPALRRRHFWSVVAGLATFDLLAVGAFWWRWRINRSAFPGGALGIRPALARPGRGGAGIHRFGRLDSPAECQFAGCRSNPDAHGIDVADRI